MNKKGFTLIEILICFAMIMTSSVLSFINFNKIILLQNKKQYNTITTNFENATEVWLSKQDNPISINDPLTDEPKEYLNVRNALYNNELIQVKVTLKELADAGLIKNNIINPLTNKSFDYNENYVKLYTDCLNQDGTFKKDFENKGVITEYMGQFIEVKDIPRTVLYEDGTLIINELFKNQSENESIHGSEVEIYDAFSDGNHYSCAYYSYMPWYEKRKNIKQVYIGSEIKPVCIGWWFGGLENATLLDMKNLNTSNITSMRYAFYNAGDLVSDSFEIKNISNWDTSKVKSMDNMFDSGRSFNLLSNKMIDWNIGDLSNWDVSNVYTMGAMFSDAGYSAKNFNIGNLDNWDVSNVTNMDSMFSGAGNNSLTFNIGNLDNWDTSNVTEMTYMFYETGEDTKSWNIGNLSNWNTSKITDMSNTFKFAGYNSTTFNIGNLNNWDTSKVTNMSNMFAWSGRNSTTWNIGDLSNWNTSNVSDMHSMFDSAGENTTDWDIGDLSNWNTSKVTNMSNMFASACSKGNIFDIGNLNNWDVSNVKDMRYMFTRAGQNAITWNIGDLSNWNVSKVTGGEVVNKGNASYIYEGGFSMMFEEAASKAKTFNIGNLDNWDVSNVNSFYSMFAYAGNNATTWNIGDISNWNMENAVNLERMFYCAGSKATKFNIGNLDNWNTTNVTDMIDTFTYTGPGTFIKPKWYVE